MSTFFVKAVEIDDHNNVEKKIENMLLSELPDHISNDITDDFKLYKDYTALEAAKKIVSSIAYVKEKGNMYLVDCEQKLLGTKLLMFLALIKV